jgi:hypothetical protein
MRIATCLIALFVATTPVHAGKTSGITMPDSITIGDQRLALNGMGLREATWLKVDVYVAGLYVESPSSSPAAIINSDEAKAIVLRFKRGADRDDIVKAWNDGFAGNATVPVSQLKARIAQLNGWMPKFDKGDTLAFVYLPGQGVAVEVNGERKGIIEGADFARSLFSIWLGPKPPTAALKRGMLGSHGYRG